MWLRSRAKGSSRKRRWLLPGPAIEETRKRLRKRACQDVRVHAKVDLVELEVKLLKSKDEKIRQRELAYLRELRYGKRASVEDSEPQIILDMQRPERDLA
jgi:hypothetical protein